MSEFTIDPLLTTATVAVRDIQCRGSCRHKSPEEHTTGAHLVFPYRGVYIRHVASDASVADANQLLLFSADETYCVSHPVVGGDACLSLAVDEAQLRELAPRALVRPGVALAFVRSRLRIDPRTQSLVARIRHALRTDLAEPLEAEHLTLALIQRALGPRTTRATSAASVLAARTPSITRGRLVDRAKLVLASDPCRRWSLAEVAAHVGTSPVYLTQLFQAVEAIPLYRYQLRLRLARALDLVAHHDDLTTLALDLGFSSHSHFTAAFRQTYGHSPSAFRHATTRFRPPTRRRKAG